MKRFFTLLSFTLALVTISCSTYKSNDYERQVNKIRNIAIMPVNIVYTGRNPANMTSEQMKVQNEEEQIVFQKTIFEVSAKRQNMRNVLIQNPNETLSRLEKSNFNIYNTDGISPSELGKILGVDAVVLSSLTKRRYRGDDESMAIDLAQTILRETVNKPLPQINTRTNDIHLSIALVNAHDGNTIWTNNRRGQVNWDSSLDLIIENMARQIVKTMPRKKNN